MRTEHFILEINKPKDISDGVLASMLHMYISKIMIGDDVVCPNTLRTLHVTHKLSMTTITDLYDEITNQLSDGGVLGYFLSIKGEFSELECMYSSGIACIQMEVD